MNRGQPSMQVLSVSMQRGGREVLCDVSVDLPVGEVLGVLGPNGAGKSSFLGACCAELPISSGRISFDGSTLDGSSALSLARTRAVLPQHSAMTFDLPVADVVSMGAYPFPQASPSQVRRWTEEAIAQIDLEHKAQQSYKALSGGEQQRAQFARVLVQTRAIVQSKGCAYLFLDEPTASLDPKHQVLLMQVTRELARESRTAVVVVLHDLNMAARWCDRLMLMTQGVICALDEPAKVLDEELLEKVYGLPMVVRTHPLHADRLIVMADV